MKILVLAPQPFYQERGTPIAVDLLVRSLCRRGHEVDLLVYHEGRDVHHPGMTLHRIPRLWGIRNVKPGFSVKKLICDAWMFAAAWRLVRRNRPDVIHAIEESAFMAWVFRRLRGIPYVYDMDSSLPDQLVEAMPFLRIVRPLLLRAVQPVVCYALVVAPVCEALVRTVEPMHPEKVVVLRDTSLIEKKEDEET